MPGGSAELAKFANSKPLLVPCSHKDCKEPRPFRGILGQGGGQLAGGDWIGAKALACSGCGNGYGKVKLQNALQMAMRKEIAAYYAAPLQCDEPSCKECSSGLSTHVARDEAGMPIFPPCTVPRCKGKMCKTYTDKQLHTQMLFYKSLFDMKWSKEKVEQDNKRRADKLVPPQMALEEEETFKALTRQASESLDMSAFHTVDFQTLFAVPTSAAVAGSPERA